MLIEGEMLDMLVKEELNIVEIIEKEMIETHFQPLISIKRKAIIGYEALSRGICPNSCKPLSPITIFSQAEVEGLTLELDRLCRKKAFEAFVAIKDIHPEAMLFLNIETSLIGSGIVGSKYLIKQIEACNLDPSSIVIEIIESKLYDLESLKKFIKMYRDYGFFFALDDVGAGFSNLDRIPITKPDVLKIDRLLINNISKEYHKKEVTTSLLNLARKIGALVVAEGIENDDDAATMIEMGADILQGYYFCKPRKFESQPYDCLDKIETVADKYKNFKIKKISNEIKTYSRYKEITENILASISGITIDTLNDRIEEIIKYFPELECIYILNEAGKQITNTVFFENNGFYKQNPLYTPAKLGDEHILKEYYIFLSAGLQNYTTDPYISLATGSLCRTICTKFNHEDTKILILCMDFRIHV
ncbi:MAG: EAL domain-containing protein [Candidatus Magnetoovum sp. WYHC-5]|nr:EAL domain-containing protein [Candidatus Magnetoovum sp. WYHC-5]